MAVLCFGLFGVASADDTSAPPRWPHAVIDRPLTLPGALVVAGFDVLALNSVTTTMTGSSSSLGWLATVALGYGIDDAIEINAITPNYTFALRDFEIKGPLDVGLGYKLLRGAAGGKLEMIARAIGGYDLKTSAVRPIRLGVHVQYNVTPRFAVFSHDIGLGNAGLSIALEGEPRPVGVTLPIGVGVQATPSLWIEADTAPISMLDVSDDASQLITDVTPLLATAVYNFMAGHLDAFGYLGFTDLQAADDTFTFGIGLRYYAGKVD